jgi:acyl-CoA thioesterase FadM
MESEGGGAAATEGPSAPTRAYEVHLDGPLRFRERFVHEVWVSRVGRTSFAFAHRISVDGAVRLRATVHRVYVLVGPDGAMAPAEVPEPLRKVVVDEEP